MRQRIIGKGNGKTRSLRGPSMTDRIVQASVTLVLEPIVEADVEPCLFWVPAEKTSPGRGR